MGCLLGLAHEALGVSGSIVQVTRQLKMLNDEDLPPKNFFLDIGSRDGVRQGEVYEVTRLIPVLNSAVGAPHSLMTISLGELEILQVGEGTSLARVKDTVDAYELPAMESSTFMIGDQVRRKSSLPFQ